MHICIVDDEKECRDRLHSFLETYAEKHGIDMKFDIFSGSAQFLSAYTPERYDIIFLDIFIDEMTGMDLAERIREASGHGMIIFCTTSLENMPQAFHFHAFEYIIKPAEYDRIEKVLDDALAVLPDLERFIEFTSRRQSVRLPLSDIISVSASGHYLAITATGGRDYSARMTLSDFSDSVSHDERFLSVNRGIFANMDHIRAIEDRSCLLDNGQELPIRIRDGVKIKEEWLEYCFRQIRRQQRRHV